MNLNELNLKVEYAMALSKNVYFVLKMLNVMAVSAMYENRQKILHTSVFVKGNHSI